MDNNKYITIAIDGAAGTGKSTTSNLLCKKYKYIHVDTGLHYRSLAFYLQKLNISSDCAAAFITSNKILLDSSLCNYSVCLNIDGTVFNAQELRNEDMNKMVSYYARIPELRSLLLQYQHSLPSFGKSNGFDGIVMDGRDIGSIVLPDADLKFFLHANLNVRENRRSNDGEIDSISSRDKLDSTRRIAPLTCPSDAVPINTGDLSPEEVINFISSHISQ